MAARRFLRPSVVAPTILAAGVFALALTVTTRPVETHPRITTALLWARDIAPILQRRCFTCHSPNNVAMSFTTYAEARPWAAAIREEVLTRQMPPWSAVAGYGHFANDPGLTQGEWDLLVAWVDGGAPSGQTLQEDQVPPVFVPGEAIWQHGEPDAVVKPDAAHSIPAGAPDQVQRFEVATGFSTDRRVHGIGFKPGGGPSLISGSMMFWRMLADVVSVARPGSSDGGSVPQLTVIVLSPPFGLLLLELLPPQDAARNARETRSTAVPKPRPSFRAPSEFMKPLHLSRLIARTSVIPVSPSHFVSP